MVAETHLAHLRGGSKNWRNLQSVRDLILSNHFVNPGHIICEGTGDGLHPGSHCEHPLLLQGSHKTA